MPAQGWFTLHSKHDLRCASGFHNQSAGSKDPDAETGNKRAGRTSPLPFCIQTLMDIALMSPISIRKQ